MTPQLHSDALTRAAAVTAHVVDASHRMLRAVTQTTVTAGITLLFLSGRAAAQTGGNTTVVNVPSCLNQSWMRLFAFVDNIVVLSIVFGTLLGVLSIVIGGVALMGILGNGWRDWGRRVIKYSVLGLIVLYSADLVVSYLFSQLAPTLC